MASKSKKMLSPSLSRTVAPFAPLALALLVGNAILPGSNASIKTAGAGGGAPTTLTSVQPDKCNEGLEDYKACHGTYPTGCNTNGSYDAYLNLFKNQLQWDNANVQGWFSSLAELQALEKKIPAGLAKGNHGDHLQELNALGEGKIYGAVGYLYNIKTEGKESSNCQIEGGDDFDNVDFHIYIGFDPDLAEKLKVKANRKQYQTEVDTTSLIVEMTPHYRGRFRPEWTAEAVQAAIGDRVRVTGQLMVDNEHYVSNNDCGRPDHTAACWRATVWELHPVTDFQVCATGSCPDQNSAGWMALGGKSGAETANAAAGTKPTTGGH